MILRLINESLWMLDPHTNRKGLGFKKDFFRMQELVDIPRRMSRRQDHRVSAKLTTIRSCHALHLSVIKKKLRHLGPKMNFATCGNDGLTHRHDHLRKEVRANMRMGFHEDFLRCTMRDEGAINLRYRAALFGTGVELAIGKGSRSAFSEAVV